MVKKIIQNTLIVLSVNLLPAVCLAQVDTDVQQLYSFIGSFYSRLLLPFGTVLAGIVILIGGIMYSASGGEPTKVKNAKDLIFGAIIGLVLLITAALIVKTIIS